MGIQPGVSAVARTTTTTKKTDHCGMWGVIEKGITGNDDLKGELKKMERDFIMEKEQI